MDGYNVENIYNDICTLNDEYIANKSKSDLFIKKLINKSNEIELAINWLDVVELKELLEKIDEKMNATHPYDPSIILRNFYSSINGRIHVMEANLNINRLGRL